MKSRSTAAASRLWPPAREDTLRLVHPAQQVMEGTRAHTGTASLLPLLHVALALATPAQRAPRSASVLQCQGAGTQMQTRDCSRDTA